MTENILKKLNMTQEEMDKYVDDILRNDEGMAEQWLNNIEQNLDAIEHEKLISIIDYNLIKELSIEDWIDDVWIEKDGIYFTDDNNTILDENLLNEDGSISKNNKEKLAEKINAHGIAHITREYDIIEEWGFDEYYKEVRNNLMWEDDVKHIEEQIACNILNNYYWKDGLDLRPYNGADLSYWENEVEKEKKGKITMKYKQYISLIN